MPKKPRACLTCHQRKVRCNADQVGLPCSRCVKRNVGDNCQFVASRKSKTLDNRRRLEDAMRLDSTDDTNNVGNQPDQLVQGIANDTIAISRQSNRTGSVHDQIHPVEVNQSATIFRNDIPAPAFDPPTTQSYNSQSTSHSATSVTHTSVREIDTELEICRELSQWRTNTSSGHYEGNPDRGREIIEYPGGISSTTILGEVFGRKDPRRIVRLILREEPESEISKHYPHLDQTDMDFLRAKNAFKLPSRSMSDQLLRVFFECVHVYTPLLDRVQFMHNYTKNTCSIFLLQSIFANVIPFATPELIKELGYANRREAQRSFFKKAQLLYDFGVEKSQIYLIQGCFFLASLHFSIGNARDYRYWFSNAARIATQIGLHQNLASRDLDLPTQKLFRRMWAAIYNRDILLTVAGHSNVRFISDGDCDMPILSEDDWEDENECLPFKDILPPVIRLQKLYMIENTKLTRISARFLNICKLSDQGPFELACRELESALEDWYKSLPVELRMEGVREWSVENVWILIMRATSCRLECIFYRLLHSRATNEDMALRIFQKQQSAMFEFGTVIDRLMLHKLARYCHSFIFMAVSTIVAMHIETALNASTTPHQRMLARIHIHNGLTCLKGSNTSWEWLNWMIRMFEVIISKTNLTLDATDNSSFDPDSANPFPEPVQKQPAEESFAPAEETFNGPQTANEVVQSHPDNLLDKEQRPTNMEDFDCPEIPSFEDIELWARQPDQWLQGFLDSGAIGIEDMSYYGLDV